MNRQVLRLSLPIFFELASQICLQIVDALMLARVSDVAAGTVGVLSTLFGFLMMLFVALAQSTSIRISYALGAGRELRAARFRYLLLVLAVALALPVALGMHGGGAQLAHRLFQLTPEQLTFARPYLSIAAFGVVSQSVVISLGAMLRSAGKPLWSLPGAVAGNLVNGVLAWFFVENGYGVQGVAWAALSGQSVIVLWAVWVCFMRLKLPWLRPSSWRLTRAMLASVGTLFIPIAVEPMAFQGAQVAIGTIVASLGAEAMAARSYANSLYAFCFLWSVSLSQSAQFLVSRELGRQDARRASEMLHSCLRTALVAGAGMALFLAATARFTLPRFTANPEILLMAQSLMWVAFVGEVGRVCNIVVGAALKAADDAVYPAKIGIAFMLGMSIPLAWCLGVGLGWGIVGVGAALATDELVRGFLNYRRWRQRHLGEELPNSLALD